VPPRASRGTGSASTPTRTWSTSCRRSRALRGLLRERDARLSPLAAELETVRRENDELVRSMERMERAMTALRRTPERAAVDEPSP